MKRAVLSFIFFAVVIAVPGCNNAQSDSDGIRAGINQHLASLNTLNLGGMDMNVMNVSIQGNQAQAQVEFRPKTGAPQGAGMQVSYSLAKQNGKWVVQSTAPAGGSIEHPAPGQNPHQGAASTSSTSLPDLRNLVNSGSANGSLPPGHPPVNSHGGANPQ